MEPIERPYSPHLKRSISRWEDEGPHLPTQCKISDEKDNAFGRLCAGAWGMAILAVTGPWRKPGQESASMQ